MEDLSGLNDEAIKWRLARCNDILARLLQVDIRHLDEQERVVRNQKERELQETLKDLHRAKFQKAMRDADEFLKGEEQ